jgi:hypothetical protein
VRGEDHDGKCDAREAIGGAVQPDGRQRIRHSPKANLPASDPRNILRGLSCTRKGGRGSRTEPERPCGGHWALVHRLTVDGESPASRPSYGARKSIDKLVISVPVNLTTRRERRRSEGAARGNGSFRRVSSTVLDILLEELAAERGSLHMRGVQSTHPSRSEPVRRVLVPHYEEARRCFNEACADAGG